MTSYISRRGFMAAVPVAAASLIAFPEICLSLADEKKDFIITETASGKLRGERNRYVEICF